MASSKSRTLTNHDEIRRWAEERNALPACVRRTGDNGDIGVLRLDFPGYSGAQTLEHVDWDEWLDKFDERGLALLVQDQTAGGQRSNFNKLVSRGTAATSRSSRTSPPRKKTVARSTAARKKSAGRKTARTSTRSRSTAAKRTSARKKGGSRASTKRASSRSRSTASRRKSTRAATSARTRTARKSASTRTSSTRARRVPASRGSRSRSRANASRKSSSKVRSISSASRRGRTSASRVLTDHDEIRRWAEERKAAPACVRGTGSGNDPGMIRLDFPGFSGARSLEHIDWNEWFRAFDENGLALLVQDQTAGGQRSNFNKLISRENAMAPSRGKSGARTTARTGASAGNRGANKPARGSNRAKRTESARGRAQSQRRAA